MFASWVPVQLQQSRPAKCSPQHRAFPVQRIKGPPDKEIEFAAVSQKGDAIHLPSSACVPSMCVELVAKWGKTTREPM